MGVYHSFWSLFVNHEKDSCLRSGKFSHIMYLVMSFSIFFVLSLSGYPAGKITSWIGFLCLFFFFSVTSVTFLKLYFCDPSHEYVVFKF